MSCFASTDVLRLLLVGAPGLDPGGSGLQDARAPGPARPGKIPQAPSTLSRGAAYAEAGADLILIHSKQKTPDEIVAFTEGWPGPVPLVIVPTAYPQLTEAKVRALGKIAIVIYANHAVRAAVGAMREVFAAIRRDGGIHQVDQRIASVDDIFNLQRVAAMKAAEKKYLR